MKRSLNSGVLEQWNNETCRTDGPAFSVLQWVNGSAYKLIHMKSPNDVNKKQEAGIRKVKSRISTKAEQWLRKPFNRNPERETRC